MSEADLKKKCFKIDYENRNDMLNWKSDKIYIDFLNLSWNQLRSLPESFEILQ